MLFTVDALSTKATTTVESEGTVVEGWVSAQPHTLSTVSGMLVEADCNGDIAEARSVGDNSAFSFTVQMELTPSCRPNEEHAHVFGVDHFNSRASSRSWLSEGKAVYSKDTMKTKDCLETSCEAKTDNGKSSKVINNSLGTAFNGGEKEVGAPEYGSNALTGVLSVTSSHPLKTSSNSQICASGTFGRKNSVKANSLLVPCLAVFSSNYNFTVTSIALFLMNQDLRYKNASENVIGNSTVKMLSYAGAIVGMCTMGYLGDFIGRRLAMIFTLSLVIIGALLSSVCAWGSGASVLIIMGVFRFILGVGSGGVYPLSAVSAAESAATDQADERSMRVSWAYSMNVPGIMFPYILALILWTTTKNVDVCFRVLLAFGALPALLIWLPAWKTPDTRDCHSKDLVKHLASVFVTRHYWRQLLGTGICWLLYDVTAYGILLVQPELTQAIWKGESSVTSVIWQNIILNGVGIPGCYMGILVLKQMGVKWLQFWGFVSLSGAAFLLAATSLSFKHVAWAQMILLCIVNYTINWGASITTFILPSIVFPPEVRSTYSGVSAALGKIGAVAGIYAMKAILNAGGIVPMMIFAGAPSIIAAVLTWFYVDPLSNSWKSAVLQCFGSLARACPFVNCRRDRRCSFLNT